MEAYIVKGYRSAVGKSKKGGFKNYRSDDLAVDVIKYLMESVNEIAPKQVDDVIVGCASPEGEQGLQIGSCLLYTSPSPRDRTRSRMPSSA